MIGVVNARAAWAMVLILQYGGHFAKKIRRICENLGLSLLMIFHDRGKRSVFILACTYLHDRGQHSAYGALNVVVRCYINLCTDILTVFGAVTILLEPYDLICSLDLTFFRMKWYW